MKVPPPQSWSALSAKLQPGAVAVLVGSGILIGGTAAASSSSSTSSSSATHNGVGEEQRAAYQSLRGRSEGGLVSSDIMVTSSCNVGATARFGGLRRITSTILAISSTPAHDSNGPHSVVMPSLSVPSILGTSAISSSSAVLLATSDAAAERAASAAAAKRLDNIISESNAKEGSNHVVKSVRAFRSRANAANGDAGENANANGHQISSDNDNNSQSTSNATTTTTPNDPSPATASSDDSYPTFTPYHNSLLKKYLTPSIWSHLRPPLQTPSGTTIEDVIRAGLALPLGANPPRRVGVLAGDQDCYEVFGELLDPIIWEYHGIRQGGVFEWEDPELPREGYFGVEGGGETKVNRGDGGESVSMQSTTNNQSEYGVLKSGGSSDEDDSSFLINEEDEEFDGINNISNNTASSATSSSSSSNSSSTTQTSSSRPNLRRHSTIINNPLTVTQRQADPEGKYIVSTRIRVARSLDGVRFPTMMSRSDRRRVQRLIEECTESFESPKLSNGVFLPVLSMTNDQNLDLIERHLLFDNPNEWTIAAGLGRDWPDGRALFANVPDVQTETPDFMIWVNEEDHLRICCLRDGGDIQGVFTTLMTGVRELESELRKRGWQFAYDKRLGFLTTCPTNVGTTMRASVHVRLVNLGRLPGFAELVERLKLEVRGKYGETDKQTTGVFDISNAERLGKSEVHLINVMVEGVAKLIELERRLEAGEMIDCDEIARE